MPADEAGGRSPSITPLLLLWLLVQLIPLSLATLDVRLADEYPAPPHRVALEGMLVTQLAGPALLLPLLYPSLASSLVLITASCPFILLGGMLGSAQEQDIWWCMLYVLMWQSCLVVLHRLAPSLQLKRMAASLVTLFVAATPILLYARRDWMPDAPAWNERVVNSASPLLAALALARGASIGWLSWTVLAGPLALGLCILLWRRFRSVTARA